MRSRILLALAVITLSIPMAVQASTVVAIDSVTVAPGGSGYFDVYVQASGDVLQTTNWNIVLNLWPRTGNTGSVQFVTPFVTGTDVGLSPRTPLAPTVTDDPANPANLNGSSTATMISACSGDLDMAGVDMIDGAGIFRVPFTASAGASGIWDVTYDLNPALTSFAGTEANDFAPLTETDGLAYANGTITVPEPATLALLSLGALLLRRKK